MTGGEECKEGGSDRPSMDDGLGRNEEFMRQI